MKIAIIGSGISGLMTGFLLNEKYNIQIFEVDNRIGGHTNTYKYNNYNIDTGFIVFNNKTYPNFIKLLKDLQVDYRKTEMSFSVRNDNWGLEYNGNNLNSLFSDRKNLLRPKFYQLIFEILRFNKIAKTYSSNNDMLLEEFLKEYKFNKWFIQGYLLPMGSAIWSMGIDDMLKFPIAFITKFFDNHGLLNIHDRPQWYTIDGGSYNYIPKIISKFKDKIHTNYNIEAIWRENNIIKIKANENITEFDQIVFACHTDTILKLFKNPNNEELNILSQFKFSKNEVILHNDKSLLPKKKLAHASWNYLITKDSDKMATLTYNMNILQGIKSNDIFCVSLNSTNLINNDKIIAKFNYSHPIYTKESIKAQNKWAIISGIDNVHYVGAYWANGFHEDGVVSALKVANLLGINYV
jgi:predicted NAD/FAD-binding protein